MSAASERPKNRRVKLVGGGYRWTRESNSKTSGGSMKSKRRNERKAKKAHKKNRK